jgi:hypothetical protein
MSGQSLVSISEKYPKFGIGEKNLTQKSYWGAST